MAQLRFLTFRLAITVPALLGVLSVTFLLSHVVPGDPAARIAGPDADAATIAQVRSDLGFDQPLLTQYWNYLTDFLRGDLGTSLFTGTPVAQELLDRVASTLVLASLAMFVAVVVGLGLAVLSAGRDRGVRSRGPRAFGTLGTAVPDYIFGLVFIVLFYTTLRWAPAPIGQSGRDAPSIPAPTGSYFLDGILAFNLDAVAAGFGHLVLPVLALAIPIGAQLYRVTRASIEQTLRTPYVDYLVVMGASPRYIWRTVAANVFPPVLTISGYIYSHLLGGAVLIEVVFGWGGVGQYAVDAMLNSDYPAIQAFVLLVAVFSVFVYVAVDLLHRAVDPRVKGAR